MPDLTSLLSLAKPLGNEPAQVSVLNGNMDILDQAVTLTGGQTLTNKTLTSPTINTPTLTGGTWTGATFNNLTLNTPSIITPSITTGGTWTGSPSLTSPTMTTVTVSSGGIAVTGNSTINGTLGSLTGLTVASGGATITAGGLTVSASGITVTGNSTINGTLGSLTGLTVASGGATITAGGLTVTAGGLTVTAGNIGLGAAPITEAGINLASGLTLGSSGASSYGSSVDCTHPSSSTTLAVGYYARVRTQATSFTCGQADGVHVGSPSKGAGSSITTCAGVRVIAQTAGGTANYGMYLGTPSGASTNQVIGSDSGAFLTTGGTWTNNPSWAYLKDKIQDVDTSVISKWADWMRDEFRPKRYRYNNIDGAYTGDGDYDHFGFLLDDVPEDIRDVWCANEGGGISTKDTDGFLLAMVQECLRRLQAVEGRRGQNAV